MSSTALESSYFSVLVSSMTVVLFSSMMSDARVVVFWGVFALLLSDAANVAGVLAVGVLSAHATCGAMMAVIRGAVIAIFV